MTSHRYNTQAGHFGEQLPFPACSGMVIKLHGTPLLYREAESLAAILQAGKLDEQVLPLLLTQVY